jgi:hypothetical protein
MKISEYRKLLEQIEFEHGDLECITFDQFGDPMAEVDPRADIIKGEKVCVT